MTGTVELACDVRFSAIVNSFQLKMKLSTPVAISPGVTSGSVTRQNADSGWQPSTSAASSISGGSALKNDIISHTAIGRLIATWVSTSAVRVSYSPSALNTRYHGPTSVITGIT